ncbi:MAG: permease [Planctomycetes bacterium SCN 63-9]|nr:MAG: permease [Planctomycetes bacterium SCN 63-9]
MSSSTTVGPGRPRYEWATRGDINAFFGLMLDNLGDMILMASLLVAVYGFPKAFVLTRMIPGTAVGVLVGDLIFTAMAFRLARRSGRSDVTAMPLGLDTPSTFGAVFLILGPAFQAAIGRGLDPNAAASHAWFLGITMILASGIFKVFCASLSDWIRRVVPRAGLLGSLSAIAFVIISFLPMLDIAAMPVVGWLSLGTVLATLTARWRLPRDIPGALAAVLLGCVVYYGLSAAGLGPGIGAGEARPSMSFRADLPLPVDAWWRWLLENWREAIGYLPVAIPLALATVVGGIDCTESAATVGDDYPTGQIIAAEGLATIVAGIFGGVIQSTPYIGHPAYKAMRARAAYTLATALFVGAAGVFGYFDWFFYLIPKSVVFPILIFVGLEITSQSFHATPRRHFPAVALACVPALAYLCLIAIGQILPEVGKPFQELRPQTQHWIQTITVLSGGFIVTSLLWGTALAHLIDGKIRPTVITLLLAGGFSCFGIIHSPLSSGAILPPNQVIKRLQDEGRGEASRFQTPYHWACAYGLMAVALIGLSKYGSFPAGVAGTEPPER